MAADSIANSIYVFNGLESLFASAVNWIITITYGFSNNKSSTIGVLFALVLIMIMRKVIALRKAYESGNMVKGIDAFVVHVGWTSFLILLLMWPMSGVKVRYIHDPSIDILNGGNSASSYTKALDALSSLSAKNAAVFSPIKQNTYTLPLVYVVAWNIGSWVVYYPFKDIAHSYFTTDLIPSLLTTDLVSASLNSDEMDKLIARAEAEADSLDSRAVVAADLIKKRLQEEFLKLNSPDQFAKWLNDKLPTITCVGAGVTSLREPGWLSSMLSVTTSRPKLNGIMFPDPKNSNATCLGFGVQISGQPIPTFDFRDNLSMSDASPYVIKSYNQLNSGDTANLALISSAVRSGDLSSISIVPNIDYFTNMAKTLRGIRPRWDAAVEDFRLNGNDALQGNALFADGVGYQFAYEYMNALYWGLKRAAYKFTYKTSGQGSRTVTSKVEPSYIDSLSAFLGSAGNIPNPSDSSSVISFKSRLTSYDQNLNDFAFELEGQKNRLKSTYANVTTPGSAGVTGGAFAALSAAFNPLGWLLSALNAFIFFMLFTVFFAKIIKQTIEALSMVLVPLQIGMTADESPARTAFSKILASRLSDLAFIFGSLVSFMVGKLVIDVLTSDSSSWIMNAFIGTEAELVVPAISGFIQFMLITGGYVIFSRIQWSSATLPQSYGSADASGGGNGGGGGSPKGAAAEAMERNSANTMAGVGGQAAGAGQVMKAVDSAAGAVVGGAKGAFDAFKSSAGGGGDGAKKDTTAGAVAGGSNGVGAGANKGSGGLGKAITSGAKALATGGGSLAGDVAKEVGKKAMGAAKDAATGKSGQSGTRRRGKGGGGDAAGGQGAGDAGGKGGGGILAGMVKGAVDGSKSRLSGQVGAGSIQAFGNMGGQKNPIKAAVDSYKKFALDSVSPTFSDSGLDNKDKNAEE